MGKAVDNRNSDPSFYNLRFERKFIFEKADAEDIINDVVFTNNFFFKEIYSRRTVNNIYFDDNNLTFYRQNVAGDGWREKYRLRWYGDDFSKLEDPTLEVKKKFGEVGDKYSFELKGFSVNMDSINIDDLNKLIRQNIKDVKLSSKLYSLFPALYNSYERRYFLSECGRYRITIDFNMKFFNPHYTNFKSSESNLYDIVLELKYGTKYDDIGRELSQMISSRLSKNSKYVRGIEIIHN